MTDFTQFEVPYAVDRQFARRAAYFCMEFGIDPALKIYSGGLGYLAGSHMRSAHDLRQNLVGIGIHWKFGYYDQVRKPNGEMDALFMERHYNFLRDTGLRFTVQVNHHDVHVKALYLAPEVFGTAPLFLLSTDLPENDHLARTITHRLYDNNPETKLAQCIVLGVGGAKLLEALHWTPETYHLNEAHALPAAFYLYRQLGSLDALRERLVFTTHTPVEAGNEKHDIGLLEHMSFFGDLPTQTVREMAGVEGNTFNHSLVALRLSKIANGVSKIHGGVSRAMWRAHRDVAEITHVTNAQHRGFWQDKALLKALQSNKQKAYTSRKLALKRRLFETVADQTGKLFDPTVLTIVWARRFAGYKRADLITQDVERFARLVHDTERPIQIIWAGKPYPQDHGSVQLFNHLVRLSHHAPNLAVLTGYEMNLSKLLKEGADVWLNNPRVPREASGTSGMTAAMNGAVNLSTWDGWIPEFSRHGHNGFTIPSVDLTLPQHEQDDRDRAALLDVLEHEILPLYYDDPKSWRTVSQNSMREVTEFFDSHRMAAEYYTQVYGAPVTARAAVLA